LNRIKTGAMARYNGLGEIKKENISGKLNALSHRRLNNVQTS